MKNWLLAAGFLFSNYIVFVVFFFLRRPVSGVIPF